jgi:hypothetical protein
MTRKSNENIAITNKNKNLVKLSIFYFFLLISLTLRFKEFDLVIKNIY